MIPEKVRLVLEANNLVAREFAPGSTPTSELAAEQLGVSVGQIAKSMVFKAKTGEFFLIICPGDCRICSKKAKHAIGSKVRLASSEETETASGFKPGGVCPFGIEGMTVLIDKGLADYKTIYPAAGNDASGVPVTFTQLQAITRARVVDVMLV